MRSFLGWHNRFEGALWHFYPNQFSNFEDENVIPPPSFDERIDAEGNTRIDAEGELRIIPIPGT